MNSKETEIEKRRILDPLIDKIFGSSRSSRNKNQSISKRTESLAGRISNDLTSVVKMTTIIKTVVQKNESSILTKPDVGTESNKSAMILNNMLSFMQKNREVDTKELETKSSFDEMNLYLREDRHKEVMDVFVEATKTKREAQRKMEQDSKKRKTTSKKIQEKTKRDVEPVKKEAPPVKKEAPPVKKEAPPVKKEAPVGRPPAPPKVTTAPKVEVPTIKPPSAILEAAKAVAPTAAKIAAGVGLAAVLTRAESADYNQLVFPKKEFRKEAPSKVELTEMTIGEVLAYQKNMNASGKYPSSAVGKYQIIRSTLLEAVKFLNLSLNTPFNEDTQDLIYKRFLISGKRKEIENFVSGKSDDIAAAQLALAKEFASFSVPEDILRPKSKDWTERLIKKGESYYVGVQGNKASVTPEQSARALVEERELRKVGKTDNIKPIAQNLNVGSNLNDASVSSADIKKNLSVGSSSSPVIIEQNIINNQQKNVNVNSTKREELNPTMRN